MSKSRKSSFALRMNQGAYIPKSFQKESSYEELIISKKAHVSSHINTSPQSPALSSSLDSAFAKVGL